MRAVSRGRSVSLAPPPRPPALVFQERSDQQESKVSCVVLVVSCSCPPHCSLDAYFFFLVLLKIIILYLISNFSVCLSMESVSFLAVASLSFLACLHVRHPELYRQGVVVVVGAAWGGGCVSVRLCVSCTRPSKS